ncbi:MAG: glycosyl transferase [Proteobacteria bacterium]|nr:glycosyl transferase [Pseudomonadota bacterium]
MWWLPTLLFAAAAALAAWAGTGLVLRLLAARAILDHPTERSSHERPTPRGAGLAVMPVVLAAWIAVSVIEDTLVFHWPVFAAAAALAAVSWLDDLRGLGALPRLAAHAAAVGVGLFALPGVGPVFQGLLPAWLDLALAALAWMWFVNLFNFMDGIDGISGAEAACIGVGLFLVALAGGWAGDARLYALIIAAAALGFLPWNWHPARIFLGDVGSVPLGYLLGWLLLGAAAAGLWAAALLLPLYYVADATATLARRLARGERVWRAHREHYYQRAVQRGLSHAAVVRAILAVNLVLAACALASLAGPAPTAAGVVIGALSVAALLWYFRGPSRTPVDG